MFYGATVTDVAPATTVTAVAVAATLSVAAAAEIPAFVV